MIFPPNEFLVASSSLSGRMVAMFSYFKHQDDLNPSGWAVVDQKMNRGLWGTRN